MNRRGFFSFTIGALITGPFMRSQPVVIQRHWTLTGEAVFKLQPGLEMTSQALREFAYQCDLTSEAFNQIRKDITVSPVFMDLEEEDDESWRTDLIPDDPDGEVIRKKMPVIGDDLRGLIDRFGLGWGVND